MHFYYEGKQFLNKILKILTEPIYIYIYIHTYIHIYTSSKVFNSHYALCIFCSLRLNMRQSMS